MDIAIVAALLISVMTFITTQLGLFRKANKEAVDAGQALLASQLNECIRARDDFGQKVRYLENEVGQLRGENHRLYERVMKLENGL